MNVILHKRRAARTERRGVFRSAAVMAFAFLAVAAVRPAGAQIGGAAVVFLMIEPDSRSAGMGNTGVAIADNAYSIFWNPAGLAFQEGVEASITHSNWLPEFDAGLYYEYLVGKYHVPGWGTFGAHVTFLNLGEHEGRDAQNNPTDIFRSYDLAAGVSYGTKVTSTLGVGGSMRFIYSNLAPGQFVGTQRTKAGVSTGFDVAALYRRKPFNLGGVATTVSAGINLANMGPKIQYSDSDQSDPIPTNVRFGYAFKFDLDQYNTFTIANDFSKILTHSRVEEGADGQTQFTSDPWYKAIFSAWKPIEVNSGTQQDTVMTTLGIMDQLMIGVGGEYWYDKMFALRLGYFYEHPYNGNREFMTFGAGIRYSLVGVDFSYIYALEEDHPLSDTMRFSLLLNLGR